MKPTRKRVSRLLAFGPALVVIAATAFVASGASIVGGATAANVDIYGSVVGSASVDATVDTTTGGATGCNDEELDTFEAGFDMTNGCTVTFAANYANGAHVEFTDAHGGAAFFCSDGDETVGDQGRDCTVEGNRVDNLTAINQPITADTVGLALVNAAGGTGGDAAQGADVVETAAPTAVANIWAPIDTTARELCTTGSPNGVGTEATCNFVVGAQGQAATGSGDYTGRVAFTTQTN